MTISLKADPGGTFGEILINGTSEGKIVAGATATDTTAGRFLKVGDFGVGAAAPALLVLDANTIVTSGFYATAIGSTNLPTATGILEVVVRAFSRIVQKFYPASGGATDGRMWLRAKFDSTWTPWRLVFDQNTILGTVSQSGGVPTGAVIERGSNANGEYIRFADGTQICWLRTLTLSHTANVDLISSWTFPSAFLVGQEPETDVSLRAAITTNSHTVAKLSSNSTPTAATLRTQFSATQDYALGLFAIGRWY